MLSRKSLVTTILFAGVLGGTLFSTPAIAQEDGDPITIGTWRTFESTLLDETRRLNIGLPSGYEDSDETYPVLYVLDGPGHFQHTMGLVRFLARNEMIPDMIVVAVGNTKRTRDMTPPTRDKEFPMASEAGGADDFVKFFREELFPFIDSEYRTHDYRVLIGHSFGGLFAIHALVNEPDTFDAYLAISPSLWWDDQLLVEQAEEFFSNNKKLEKTLYMTMGNEGGDMRGGMLKLEGVLTEQKPSGFEWASRVMEEETHASVPYRSTRQGLEYIFRHWQLRDATSLYESGGVDAIYTFFRRAEKRYGLPRTSPPRIFANLVQRLADDDRLEEAQAVLEHDVEKFKPSAMHYATLAEKYEERGDNEKMIACYTRALELNPADSDVREKLIQNGVDTEALAPKPAELSADELAEYAGNYEDDQMKLTIELVEDHLELSGIGLPATPLSVVKKDHFVMKQPPFELQFTRDEAGKVTMLKATIGGDTVGEAKRVDTSNAPGRKDGS